MLGREHRCEWRERAEELEIEVLRLRHSAAFVDPETGVGNLQQLDFQFIKLVARWRRSGEPFSVATIALTDPVVAGFGPSSRSIVRLANVLMESAREEDTVSRVSRNEFAVLLANADMAGATTFLERTRNRIAQDAVPAGEGSNFVRSAGGAAQWADSAGSLAGLLDEAHLARVRLFGDVSGESKALLAAS